MIHLRRGVLSRLLHPPRPTTPATHSNPLLSLHLLSSAAAVPVSPKPFAVEDYLVDSCGLTRARAEKVSRDLSHLKSPSKPDGVLAALSGLGLSRADIGAAVASDPKLLCADVGKTLEARVGELSGLGMSRSQIARLVPLVRSQFRCKSLGRRLAFLIFGSFDRCLEVVRMNYGVLNSSHEKVVKPNLAVLQQCGITITNWPSNAFMARAISGPTKHLEETVLRANEFGVKQGERMFVHAVVTFAILSQEKFAKKLGLFKKLGWPQDDLSLAVKSMPQILAINDERLRKNMKYLTKDVGLEVPYIARRPAILYSVERWLLKAYLGF